MTHHVSTPAQRHTQQLQHLRAALRAAGLHGTRAGMRPLQQRPSRQVAVGSETEALSSRQRVVAGSPQAAHRQVRAAVSTLDCSQQAPRRSPGSGSVGAMSRLSEALREQRGGGCARLSERAAPRRPGPARPQLLRRFGGQDFCNWVRLRLLEIGKCMGGY